MRCSVEDPNGLVPLLHLLPKHFDALGVTVPDNNVIPRQGINLVIALPEVLHHLQLETVGISREESRNQSRRIRLLHPLVLRLLSRRKGEAEERLSLLFLLLLELLHGQVGMNEIPGRIINLLYLAGQLKEARHSINHSLQEIGLNITSFFFPVGDPASLHFFTSNHFKEQGVIFLKGLVEVVVVFLVPDMDRSNQVNSHPILRVAGHGSLEPGYLLIFLNPDEVGGVFGLGYRGFSGLILLGSLVFLGCHRGQGPDEGKDETEKWTD